MGRLVHTVNPNRILPIRKPAYLSSRPGVNDVMKTKIYLALKYSYYGERRSYLVIRIPKVGVLPSNSRAKEIRKQWVRLLIALPLAHFLVHGLGAVV